MDKKVEVVTKTYGSSWVTVIVLAIICGMVGYLISPSPQGFIVGFVMVILLTLLMLLSFIPYVGIWFQWQWSTQVCSWLFHIGNYFNASQIATFNTLMMFPLILFTIFGAIIFIVVSAVVTVFIGALIGALF